MSEEFDIIFKLFDSLGTLGVLLFIIFSFYKGWLITASTQSKLDAARNEVIKEIAARHLEVSTLLQVRVKDLENLLEERAARAEQGVRMLSMYVDAQDTLSKLADHLNESSDHE